MGCPPKSRVGRVDGWPPRPSGRTEPRLQAGSPVTLLSARRQMVDRGTQQRGRNGPGVSALAAWVIAARQRPVERIAVAPGHPLQFVDRRRGRLLRSGPERDGSGEESVGERHASEPAGPRML